MQRLMGLDLGSKTIGVALSDPLGYTAQGHSVIQRQSKEKDLLQLQEIIVEYDVGGIILGLPKNMNNSIGPQAEQSLAFAEELRTRFNMKVVLWDERLSSRAANNLLQQSGRNNEKRRRLIDMVAATLILESYLRKQQQFHDEPFLSL